MIGAILGDIIGSPYEFSKQKIDAESFPLFTDKSYFTDDTIHSLAVANAIRLGYQDEALTKKYMLENIHKYTRLYPRLGYGAFFTDWINSRSCEPYNSYGNGSAMRVSSVGWAYDTMEDVQKFAKISAEVTHNHPEGIKGAVATASAIFLARSGTYGNTEVKDVIINPQENIDSQSNLEERKLFIKNYISETFGYNLEPSLEEVRASTSYDETCQSSVPQALIAFLHSSNLESCIRNAISFGGDTDTIAAIAGSIADAFYQDIPFEMGLVLPKYLDEFVSTEVDIFYTWLREKNETC